MKIDLRTFQEGDNQLEISVKTTDLNFLEVDGIQADMAHVKLVVHRDDNIYRVSGVITSVCTFICHRCLKEFDREICGGFEQVIRTLRENESQVKITEEEDNLDDQDNINIVRFDQNQYDLTESFRDALALAIPYKILCSNNCKGICSGCGVYLNEEECKCNSKPVDPRLKAFEKLKKTFNS